MKENKAFRIPFITKKQLKSRPFSAYSKMQCVFTLYAQFSLY